MFTNALSGEVLFTIAFVSSEPDATVALFEDLNRRLGGPAIYEGSGALNFGYLAPDPVRAGPHKARFECFALLDEGGFCLARAQRADAFVVASNPKQEGGGAALVNLLASVKRDPNGIVIVWWSGEEREAQSRDGERLVQLEEVLPGAIIAVENGSPFDAFKTVAKLVLTVHKHGKLREHNADPPATWLQDLQRQT